MTVKGQDRDKGLGLYVRKTMQDMLEKHIELCLMRIFNCFSPCDIINLVLFGGDGLA